MKLFLSAGGSQEDSKELDKEFAKEIKGKLLYIPIAMEEERHSYPDCFKWLKSCFNPLNIYDIEMWTNLKNKDLKKYSAIYIGGGNTFKLLKELKESGFDKELLKFIKEGKPVYGGSAGALILGKNILTSHDENKVKLKDLNGLNLINENSIWAHYSNKENEKIFNYVKTNNINVVAIPEGSGIYFNGKIRVIGKDSYLFNKQGKTKIT